jgi:DNA-binding NarL/FixJ family response regulator
MIKVLLVEDQTLPRAGFRALLDSSDELEVVGEAANGREAVRLAKKLNPDVVLMDVAMPEMNGMEATRQIHAAQPHIRIHMLSMHTNRQYLFESLRAGAAGFVPKDSAFTELLSAIHAVVASGTYLSPPLADLVLNDYFRRAQGKNEISELEVLSNREREVLQLIAEGNSSAEIAQAMHISARTVDTHRHNIMKKLDIHSIAGLTKFAIRHGLCSL